MAEPARSDEPAERPLALELSAEVLRNGLVLVALLTSVGLVLAGVTAEHAGWVVGAVAAGVAGGALVIVAMVRGWGRWQWPVYLGVIAADLLLMTGAAG